MRIFLHTVYLFHKQKLYLIPLFIIALFFFYSVRERKISFIPGIDPQKIIAFDDHEGGGNSLINIFKLDSSGATLQYTLQEKLQYPYAGLKLILKKDSLYKDLSGYDYFSIDLSLKTQQEIGVYFHTIIPGFTNEADVRSYLYLLKSFTCNLPQEHFTVPIRSFAVPTWWHVINKFPDDSLKKESFKQVAEIVIQSGYNIPLNKPVNFTIKRIYLIKSISKRVLWALGACFGWLLPYGFVYLLYKNLKGRDERKVVISYEPLVVSNDSDDCLERICACIAKEYKNPDLTVSRIATEVGVLPVKMTQILRDKKNCSYKQYLNAIRLTEAKRLLLETDRNIVDIAMKVGYNNVTHFNRIFKEVEGISPRQFRTSASNKE